MESSQVNCSSSCVSGLDERGARVPCGIYFCRLQAADRTSTTKMLLVK